MKIEWEEGDAEALPYDDGAFDVVLSCVGVMFAPHHQQAADELVRVCRPGGTIGLLSWTPTGFVGEMFKTMKPYAPPPPPGAQPPPLWGDEDHVRALLGDRVTDVVARRQTLTTDLFPTPEAWRDVLEDRLRADHRGVPRHRRRPASEVAALDRDLTALAARFDRGTGVDGHGLGVPDPHRPQAGLTHRHRPRRRVPGHPARGQRASTDSMRSRRCGPHSSSPCSSPGWSSSRWPCGRSGSRWRRAGASGARPCSAPSTPCSRSSRSVRS